MICLKMKCSKEYKNNKGYNDNNTGRERKRNEHDKKGHKNGI